MSYLVPLIAVVFVVVASCYLTSVPQEEDHQYVIAILGFIVPLIIMAIGVEAFWKRSSSLAVTSSGLSSDVSNVGLLEMDIQKRMKNKAKNDKTEHGMEKCEKTKPNQSQKVNQVKKSTEQSKSKSTPTKSESTLRN
ncbi:hypothetical protein Tco_0103254 [Tanacetum coccineum]